MRFWNFSSLRKIARTALAKERSNLIKWFYLIYVKQSNHNDYQWNHSAILRRRIFSLSLSVVCKCDCYKNVHIWINSVPTRFHAKRDNVFTFEPSNEWITSLHITLVLFFYNSNIQNSIFQTKFGTTTYWPWAFFFHVMECNLHFSIGFYVESILVLSLFA